MEEKRGEGKKRRRDTIGGTRWKNAQRLCADVGPAGVETTTLEPRVSNRIRFLGHDDDDEREEKEEKGES